MELGYDVGKISAGCLVYLFYFYHTRTRRGNELGRVSVSVSECPSVPFDYKTSFWYTGTSSVFLVKVEFRGHGITELRSSSKSI